MSSSIYQGGDGESLTPFFPQIEKFISENYGERFSLMDFGCGICLTFEKTLLQRFPHIKLGGVDINTPKETIEGFSFYLHDIQKKRLFRDDRYDIVYFAEVIEHIDDGDILLDNCYLNCRDDGYLICTIPNLASLFGRVELLMGMQPHVLEASNRYPLAGTGFFGKRNNPDGVSIHHIRGITYKAMRELIERHGFTIIKTKGYMRVKSMSLLSAFPSLCGDVLFIARKK